MSVMMKSIDSCPYTGVRDVRGKVRVKTSDEAWWLDKYFERVPDCERVEGITRGRVYEVVRVEGFGDCEDITIIDDNGEELTLADFFFAEVDE